MKLLNYHYLSYDMADMRKYIPSKLKFINTDYYGYNLAAVPIPNTDYELYCIRFCIKEKEPESKTDLIVPGNQRNGMVFKGPNRNLRESHGENFWWSRWAIGGLDSSFFFIGNFDGVKITKLSKFLKLPNPNESFFAKKVSRVGTDHRVVNINNRFYLHSRTIHYMVEIIVDTVGMSLDFGKLIDLSKDNKMTLEIHRHLNSSFFKVLNKDTILIIDVFNKKNGKEHISKNNADKGPLTINLTPEDKANLDILQRMNIPPQQKMILQQQFIMKHIALQKETNEQKKVTPGDIDGTENGINFLQLNIRDNKVETIKKHLIYFNKDKPYCFGSKTEPLFSFGCPTYEYEPGKFLGMGHIKIKQRYNTVHNQVAEEYEPTSSPFLNREFLHDKMFETFGTNYVTHFGHRDGYIYMSFFYFVDTLGSDLNKIMTEPNPEKKSLMKMYISDPFLPINMDENHASEIKSSLIFSLSLFEKNKPGDPRRLIHITSGEADFYGTIMTYELNDILADCKHDVSEFDFQSFKYHFILYYDHQSFDIQLDPDNKTLLHGDVKYQSINAFLNDIEYPYKIKSYDRMIK